MTVFNNLSGHFFKSENENHQFSPNGQFNLAFKLSVLGFCVFFTSFYFSLFMDILSFSTGKITAMTITTNT